MADTAVEATPAEPPKAETGTAEEILSQEKAETATNGKKKAAETTHNDTAKTGPGSTKDKEDQDNKKIGRDWNNRPKHRGGNSGRQIDKKFSKREGAKNMSKNVGNLSKLTFDEPSDDPVQIRKQVEFYFSDSNLPNDRFLFNLVGGAENKAVPISVIHNFKRMRHFQPFSAIVSALKESSTLNVVEVERSQTSNEVVDKEGKSKSDAEEKSSETKAASEKKENDEADAPTTEFCIQRKKPLPEGTVTDRAEVAKVFETEAMARTIYAKGFGEEKPTTQFDLEAFFSTYGHTNAVRLRRLADRTFKGSVFVEFDTEETAKKFLALDPKPKYHGNELIILSKKEYMDQKVADINAGFIHADDIKDSRPPRSRKGDDRDWRERREDDRKKGFPPVAKGKRGQEGHARKRSREEADVEKEDEKEERAAKKVDTEGAAAADNGDENVTDAPAQEIGAEVKEEVVKDGVEEAEGAAKVEVEETS